MKLKKVIKKIMSDFKNLRKGISSDDKNITLSNKELEFLLELIAKSNFEGRDIQIVYETAVKIQQLLIPKK
jgi:ribosomal protein L4